MQMQGACGVCALRALVLIEMECNNEKLGDSARGMWETIMQFVVACIGCNSVIPTYDA